MLFSLTYDTVSTSPNDGCFFMGTYAISILASIIMFAVPNTAELPVAPVSNHSTGIISVANAAEHEVTTLEKKAERYSVTLTAYSSTPEETDDSPFITASNTRVRDGIVATNFLPFGTKVKIPALFGDKVFTVEDRMHQRKQGFVDIWMPTKAAALRFGITKAEIEVVADES